MVGRIWRYVAADLAIGTAVLLVFYALSLMWIVPDDVLFHLFFIGMMVAGMASVIFAFMVRLPVPASTEAAIDSAELTRRLRVMGLMAAVSGDMTTVTLDQWAAVKVHVPHGVDSRKPFMTLDGTTSSTVVILLLFLSGYAAIGAVPLSAYLLYRTLWKTDAMISSGLAATPSSDRRTQRDEIKENLLEGLSEARRLANEAYIAANSAYQDMILLSITLVGLLGGVSLFVLLSQTELFPLDDRFVASLLAGMAISIAASILLILMLSRRMRPNVLRLSDWVRRLDFAVARELSPRSNEEAETSIEILFTAYDQVPSWLRARRKGALLRDPVSTVLEGLLVIWSATALIVAVPAFFTDILAGLETLAVGVLLAVAAYLLYRNAVRQSDRESRRLREEWDSRRLDLSKAIEERLGGR